MISAKIVRHYGKRISKLFYKFPVSTDPIKFTEIELVDDKDVETMVKNIYSQSILHGIDIDLNAASETDAVGDDRCDSSDPSGQEVDSDPDVDEVPVEFQEYPNILPAHRMTVDSDLKELFMGQKFESKEGGLQSHVYTDIIYWGVLEVDGRLQLVAYELEPHLFRQRMTRLESDMEGEMNTPFRQWLGTMKL
ncbi:hypothetical protein GOBAR_DD08190 [Gossypium barbadense]|nr:hypothetical protein GOBAR_DD08190 [Gossypium barbadense]